MRVWTLLHTILHCKSRISLPAHCLPLPLSACVQASSHGYFAMVQLFSDHGADLSLRDNRDRTPWKCAVENDKRETAGLLRRLWTEMVYHVLV